MAIDIGCLCLGGEVVLERAPVDLRGPHPAHTGDPRDLLGVLRVVDDRHAALPDRVEVGVREAALGHEFVDVHQNHLSSPSSLSVSPLGGVHIIPYSSKGGLGSHAAPIHARGPV